MAGIDGDSVRQALIIGMRHLAAAADCRLIAEGIETEAEMATLLELEVPLGQGYLLGPPAPPASDWADDDRLVLGGDRSGSI